MAWRSYLNRAAYASRMARTSSTIGSCHDILGLREFFGSTNNRGLIASRPAYVFNVAPNGRVGKVRTVPGEQVLHPVHGRNRNMQGVDYGVGRQRPRCDEGLGEPGSLLAQSQERNALEGGET